MQLSSNYQSNVAGKRCRRRCFCTQTMKRVGLSLLMMFQVMRQQSPRFGKMSPGCRHRVDHLMHGSSGGGENHR